MVLVLEPDFAAGVGIEQWPRILRSRRNKAVHQFGGGFKLGKGRQGGDGYRCHNKRMTDAAKKAQEKQCNARLFRMVDFVLMSLLDDKRDDLEKYEFMMGVPRGRLAVALDLLTDALVLVGQHGVYCRSTRQPNKPAMDLQIVLDALNSSKELISSVMEELGKSSSQ